MTDDDWLSEPLRSLPDLPMPQEVVTRLDAVIARESASRATDELAARRRRRTPWLVAAAAVVGIAVAGAVLVPMLTEPAPPAADAQMAISEPDFAIVPVSSGSSYSAANVDALVPQQLSQTAATAAPVSMRRSTFTESADGIRSCLQGVRHVPATLRMLDLARFDDSPAVVMAFLTDNSDSTADVIVVGMRCTSEDPQVRYQHESRLTAAAQ